MVKSVPQPPPAHQAGSLPKPGDPSFMVSQVLEVLSDVTLNLDNSRNTGKDINIQTVLYLEQLQIKEEKIHSFITVIFILPLNLTFVTQKMPNFNWLWPVPSFSTA